MGQFLRLVVAAAGALAFAGSVQAQQAVNLKVQATWPASSTLYDNFTFFADRVGKLSGGSLTITTMPAGQVVPAFEVLDAVSKKVIDGSHSWAAYWTGKNKAAVLFTGGPGGGYGMDMVDAMGWLYEGGGLDLYREFYKDVLKVNVVPFPILPAGPQAFGWFKRPIRNLKDFKGMKCRETGIANEIFSRMGMATVNMPGGEILPSAQRGVIDCAEWVGGVEDLRLGLQNVWKYHYTPGMHEAVTIAEFTVNGDVWNSLSPQHKEIIASATTETFLRWWIKQQHDNGAALREMREKYGVHVLRTPADILIAFLKEWDKLAAEESAKNPFFKKVRASQRTYASVVVPMKRFYFPPYSFAANYYWPEKRAKRK